MAAFPFASLALPKTSEPLLRSKHPLQEGRDWPPWPCPPPSSHSGSGILKSNISYSHSSQVPGSSRRSFGFPGQLWVRMFVRGFWEIERAPDPPRCLWEVSRDSPGTQVGLRGRRVSPPHPALGGRPPRPRTRPLASPAVAAREAMCLPGRVSERQGMPWMPLKNQPQRLFLWN